MDDVLTAARRLLVARRFKAALKLLEAADPAGRDHAVLTGIARLGRRDPAGAAEALRRALARDPGDLKALFHLGHARLAGSAVLDGVRLLERVAAAAPDFPGIRDALAGAYRRDARYADAVRVADEGLRAGSLGADLLYEKAMSLAHLGDSAGALAVYDALLATDPEHAAAWFGSHAAALGRHGIAEALGRLRRATACTGANGKYWAYLCAYHRLLGQEEEARAIYGARLADNPRRLPLIESVTAILPHLAGDARLFGVGAELLRHALAQAGGPGMVLEFGVRRGTSITQIAAAAGQAVHGFDSFEGLPEAWVNTPQGVLSTGRELPPVPPNVTLHAGWFEDTLPPFLRDHQGPVRFVNVDSDLYSSAKTVLTALAPRFRPGTVLVFDEFIGNRTWREDEYKAFHEYARDHRAAYEIIAVSPFTKQVAIRLTAIGGAEATPL